MQTMDRSYKIGRNTNLGSFESYREGVNTKHDESGREHQNMWRISNVSNRLCIKPKKKITTIRPTFCELGWTCGLFVSI